MKNLLIYVNPRQDFDEETKILAKIQIDNSLNLGWKKEDIILVTNFPYEYRGIKAFLVPGDTFCVYGATASKANVIVWLFENGIIKKELYWNHDFDAYQLVALAESELDLEDADMALADYGRMPRWHTSSVFFKQTAVDIFKLIKETVYEFKLHNEEDALFMLTENNTQEIGKRIKKINITYNFWGGNIKSTYPMADKPLKCVHFHPDSYGLDEFMYGKNKINKILIDDRLIKLFNKHGLK